MVLIVRSWYHLGIIQNLTISWERNFYVKNTMLGQGNYQKKYFGP
jgi:hypothetical protein